MVHATVNGGEKKERKRFDAGCDSKGHSHPHSRESGRDSNKLIINWMFNKVHTIPHFLFVREI